MKCLNFYLDFENLVCSRKNNRNQVVWTWRYKYNDEIKKLFMLLYNFKNF